MRAAREPRWKISRAQRKGEVRLFDKGEATDGEHRGAERKAMAAAVRVWAGSDRGDRAYRAVGGVRFERMVGALAG